MNDLFLLSDEQMTHLAPLPPQSHGQLRVDGGHVLISIIFKNRNGLYSTDTPVEYRLVKTLYNNRTRWGDMSAFARMMADFPWTNADPSALMIAPPTEIPPSDIKHRKKGDRERLIGRTKGGLETKLHVVT